jgi:uncharacterized LabA/DUF88 family protein
MKSNKKTAVYTYIDASNIIYGTRDEGWKVDFRKLYKYLKERYYCKNIYYFAGFEEGKIKQQKFYKILRRIGYTLVLKPVKIYIQPDGNKVRKANCDVDLTFYAMRDKGEFNKFILLSGDGDFEILLKYFVDIKKEVIVISSSKRTAKEIKQMKGIQFNDLGSLRYTLNLQKK